MSQQIIKRSTRSLFVLKHLLSMTIKLHQWVTLPQFQLFQQALTHPWAIPVWGTSKVNKSSIYEFDRQEALTEEQASGFQYLSCTFPPNEQLLSSKPTGSWCAHYLQHILTLRNRPKRSIFRQLVPRTDHIHDSKRPTIAASYVSPAFFFSTIPFSSICLCF